MRTRFSCGVAAVFLLALGCVAAAQSSDNTMYFPVGKTPAKLKDFQCFGLNRENGKLSGWVMMDCENPNESTILMNRVALKGGHLSFRTNSKKGVSFRFEGSMVRNRDIEGTVTRLKSGRKQAEGKMRFRPRNDAG